MIRVRLDELLKQRNLSRYWLAKEAELSQATVARIYKGETTGMDFPTLNSICKALNCKPGDLLDYVEDENKGKEKAAVEEPK